MSGDNQPDIDIIARKTPSLCPACLHPITDSWNIHPDTLRMQCQHCLYHLVIYLDNGNQPNRSSHRRTIRMLARMNTSIPPANEREATNFLVTDRTPALCPTCDHRLTRSWKIYSYAIRSRCRQCSYYVAIMYLLTKDV